LAAGIYLYVFKDFYIIYYECLEICIIKVSTDKIGDWIYWCV